MSLFGNFLFSIFMLQGVAMSSAATAGVILATLPALVALLGAAVLRERLDGPQRAAVGLAVAGVAVLAAAGPDGGSAAAGAAAGATAAPSSGAGSVAGALLVFACVCCEAVYVVLGRRLAGRMTPMRISAAINLVGLSLMTPFGLAQALRFDFGAVAAPTWALLAFYALAASVASTWLWLSGLRQVPASQAGVFTIAMPLAASLVGTAWLGEAFGGAQALALAFAVAGIALIARSDSGTPRVAEARPPTGQS
ncbi:DMT family transporter [Quisquiliibacterium transsilvanicum]|uniref:Drug/metabolite transporter (DMT)-like permease n=1 Tax=Quisquiliibacterium transsilvanicum TaxID=1549638 RepID=A0A7W8HGB7_9BURK|nr:drug/metabolite transporter (DMT)-like permease [Quisquiliibacterium transsilvanicum]